MAEHIEVTIVKEDHHYAVYCTGHDKRLLVMVYETPVTALRMSQHHLQQYHPDEYAATVIDEAVTRDL